MPVVRDVGAIHRARLPTYRTLGDVHKLLPQTMATGPFASSTAAVVKNARFLATPEPKPNPTPMPNTCGLDCGIAPPRPAASRLAGLHR